MNELTRPVLRWFGGKWLLAPWILEYLPQHRIYVEPFGGAASVLLRKPRSYAEVYNDLDHSVVNLFRVLRDAAASLELIEQLRLTPFAREEFDASFSTTEDPVEKARQLIVRSFMGFGANAHVCDRRGRNSTGFRSSSNRSGSTPAQDWKNYPDALPAIIDRLRGVTIESRDAKVVMASHDTADTLHYVDPPYVWETRSSGNIANRSKRMYRHDMDDASHGDLLDFLKGLKGMVVLSGYPTDHYDEALHGWHRVEREAFADGARPRTEVLWINPAAEKRIASMPAKQTSLFEGTGA